MESRSIKIKDYVTHERVPVRGDSHGNFTLSPLGFPFVNRSGYVPGGVPPTTFNLNMLVKPDLTENESAISAILEYKDAFKFPRTDSDHDTFIVKATLVAGSEGYTIQTDSATFFENSIVTISVDDLTYEAVNGDYTVTGENYIETEPQSGIPEEGISCSVTFRPELTRDAGVDPLFIKFTGSEDNNGVYKLIVDEDDNGILHYTWMYKTSVQDSCESQELPVEFDETMNDNVHDHYRNRFSDQEVADYITHVLGAAVECGKFRGAEYPADAHGLLVKWFLSRGAIVHSVAGKTVVIDGFGHVIDTSGIGNCSGTPRPEEENEEYVWSNIGKLNDWLMSTSGTNDYMDYPSGTLQGINNNIRLNVENSGERHTFVIQQDLEDMVNNPPRKTFIHLPAALDLADGTEVELNVALPVVSQPNTVSQEPQSVTNALKSFTDYVSQPRVYILSGKQNVLPNNGVMDSGISTSGNSFTLRTRHPMDVDDGSTIAFGLLNRYECPKTFRFTGTVDVATLTDGRLNDDHLSVLFNGRERPTLNKGDYILLKYDVDTPLFGKVTHEEEKLVVSSKESDDGLLVTFSTPVVFTPSNDVHGFISDISVNSKFPYDTSSRRWKIYTKEPKRPTCIVDIKTVNDQDGLTEHTEDSGAFTASDPNQPSLEPELIDNDSIIATIYPTSTNTFPWRLNGRTRVRHLGLTTNANVDYVDGGDKPLTRLVFEMNERVYSGFDSMFRGAHPISELRYGESNNDTAEGNSVLGSLLRVYLPQTLDADVDDEHKDEMYVVSRATKAFHDLIGDFKVARVGYVSTRDYENKKNTSWGFEEDRTIDPHNPETYICPLPETEVSPTEPDNLQRLNDWETKIIHLPNYCLGVDAELNRNLAYAGWNEYTHKDNFRIFYDKAIDKFVDSNGYDPSGAGASLTYGNVNYRYIKDASGTTQRTVDNFNYSSDEDIPFNYTAENSVFKLFIKNADEKTLNQYGAFVNGFLDLPIIKRGLRSISWLDPEEGTVDFLKRDCEFTNRDMEPFYPMSHVMSTDGVAFPVVSRNTLRVVAQSTDEDVKRALLAIPDKVAVYNDETTRTLSSAELISANIPNPEEDDENETMRKVIDYMKSLLTMYSNGMPLHMYDAHRAINVDSPNASDPYGALLNAHEITLYNRIADNMEMQHRYCDLAYNDADGEYSEDINMTYNLISSEGTDPPDAPLSLTTPLENVSPQYISNVFKGMYTRVHVKAMFSSSLGRWVVKDYRQYPSCYLTPLYGAKTLDYTEKSYAYGNPKKYANRVPMSEGVENKKFSVSKYIAACPEQPLWQMPCGVGSDYTDAMNKRYVDVPPMEMNPGCVPFLLESFPYDDDGKVNNSVKFRNLYESVSTPMDANGDPKEGSVPEVNFWNIKLHIRPARSAYPGADIPSNSARTGGTLGEPTLGMFNDPITI